MSAPIVPVYMDPEELAVLVQDPAKVPKKDYLVIDVRTTDYVGGHIPGGINLPASQFYGFLEYINANFATVPLIVVHCALSQVRGPKSARILTEYFQTRARTTTGTAPALPQVKILRGGITDWVAKYKDVPGMIEDFDAELWESELMY
ncbi:Rhodanese-like domain-containing protein [Dimargaris cristalligena]|uniref:Rhodanese-like domain-containing protein n=1 Tax=Dimargaris cristalligena TaxID=215637 RepID=A0A4P9ZYG0_9FUNG|nr:Rhodanese-like domain-containing protein [Dimargaris cristalligena]|eukprot:RKP37810.1 Rhodanese-like domain-containing protein [Dimargaris cristalligena]